MSKPFGRDRLSFFRAVAAFSLLGCLAFAALTYWRGDGLERVQVLAVLVAALACLVTFGAFGPESDNDARR